MRLLQQLGKFSMLMLMGFLISTTAYGQACTFYLNVTEGSDTNSGTSVNDPWQSFEFAFNNATDGATVCTEAGEYFRGDDEGGVTLMGDKSMTFLVQSFSGNATLLFSSGPFTVDVDPGNTVTIQAENSETLVFGAGVNNIALNGFPGPYEVDTINILSGSFNTTGISTTIESTVTTINRDTNGSWTTNGTTYDAATRTINITGDDSVSAGGELPPDLGDGTLNILTTAGTYTAGDQTLDDGGAINVTGDGNATFGMLTASSSGTTPVSHSGAGTLTFGGIDITATGPGISLDNTGSGTFNAGGITFNHAGAANTVAGDNDFPATITNSADGTFDTGILADNGNDDPDRVRVTVDNSGTGTVKTYGTIGGDLMNTDTVTLTGDLLLEGDLANTSEIAVGGWNFSLKGGAGQTYNNDGNITGSGWLVIEEMAVIDDAGPGGDLPNVNIAGGTGTVINANSTGDITNAGTTTVVTLVGTAENVSNTSGSLFTITGSDINGNFDTVGDATVMVGSIGGNVTADGNADITATSIGGNVTSNGGTTDLMTATSVGGDVVTAGTGGVTFSVGTSVAVGGSVEVGGSGTVSNPGSELGISGDLMLNGGGGTFMMMADVEVDGNYGQSPSSTFDFGASHLSLKGNYTRTGGTVIFGTGLLSFIGQGTQTFQGSVNLGVYDMEIVGLGTEVVFMEGTVEVNHDFTIGNNASMDLDGHKIKMVGVGGTFTNDGSYTSSTDGKVRFQNTGQFISGNGLFGNITIDLPTAGDVVTVTNTPNLEITMSGVLDFRVGGIDLAGFDWDFSTANQTPKIRRNMNGDPVNGGFFTLSGATLNTSGTDFDLEYYGDVTKAGGADSGTEFDTNVNDLIVMTTGLSVNLIESESIAGNLTVDSGADLNLDTFTLTTGVSDATHTVSGMVTNGGLWSMTGTGTISGGGTVDNLTVSSAGSVDIANLGGLGNFTVNAGTVSVGLDLESNDPVDNGNIDNYAQNDGTVSLTTDVDVLTSFDLSGGTFNNGTWTVVMQDGSALTAEQPGVFTSAGGYISYVGDGTINTDNDGDVDPDEVAIPRLMLDAGGSTLTATGRVGVSEVFDHVDGTVDLAGNIWRFIGPDVQWNVSGAQNYGTGQVTIWTDAVTLNFDGDMTLDDLRVNTGDTSFTLVDSDTDDGVTPHLMVSGVYTQDMGTVHLDGTDIILTGPGAVYDYNAGAYTMVNGSALVFAESGGLAQSFTFADGLSLPNMRIENDVTANNDTGVTTFTVTENFTYGSNGSTLTFSDADATITFVDNTWIVRDGTGTIEESETPDAQTPIFPTEGWVNVKYTASVTSATELPGDVGTLVIDPDLGDQVAPKSSSHNDVTLDKAITVHEELDLTSGNLVTVASGTETVTMGENTIVRRTADGTCNVAASSGGNLMGGPYTLFYDLFTGDITSMSCEFPDGVTIALDVTGDSDFDLHATRSVSSITDGPLAGDAFNMDLDGETFDLNGFSLTAMGTVNVNDGDLFDNTFPASVLDVTGDLNVGAPGSITGVDVNVSGNAALGGDYVGGTFDVEGNTTLDASFTGTLNTAGDVTVGTDGALGAAFITFDGMVQDLALNGPISPESVTLAQTTPTDGMAMVNSHGGNITVKTNLNLFNGLLVLGEGETLTLPTAAQSFTRVVAEGDKSHVVGSVCIIVPAGTPIVLGTPANGRFEYPVGSLNDYREAAITFEDDDPAITSATICVNHLDSPPTGTSGFPIGPITGPADFNWLISSSVGFGSAQTFELELLGAGFTDFADVDDIRIIRRLDGDVTNKWVQQGGDYSNFATTPPNNDPLVRTSNTTGGLVAQGALFTFGINTDYTASLNGVNEVDPVVSDASGFASATFDEGTKVLTLSGTFSGLGSDYTASHIHMGAAGENGGVWMSLTASLNADNRSGEWEAADNSFLLPDSLVDMLTAEGLYLNVHTINNAPGEIRGQLLPAPNDAPSAAEVIFPSNGSIMDLTGEPSAPFEVIWGAASDPNGNNVVYAWQLSLTESFSTIIVNKSVGANTTFPSTVGDIAVALTDAGIPTGGTVTVYHRVISTDGSEFNTSSVFTINVTRGTLVDVEDEVEIPTEFALEGNYPNPFNPTTTIQFDLPETSEVTIEIVNMLGQRVMTLPRQTVQAGANRKVQIDALNLSSGMYLYRVLAVSPNNTWVSTGRMTLIK